jgi:hypothetical protein
MGRQMREKKKDFIEAYLVEGLLLKYKILRLITIEYYTKEAILM